ncbi:TetR/AcrR family transcriptional regulator [Rhodopseudomonas sp. HC1]|uniref:TetR/AcrR family transcriptional regulator n=1 Tax=Rhodopseudomonas infernalis TaxID=2897386 RepID=UPI001EE98761|nr:TetR/AcrR family transcriptional regulator [Rhodopseudomonas infernalis]MCG6204865.1 TetR/AcrR family transcriptional regulator [Rhodopseudomonas infernalis]
MSGRRETAKAERRSRIVQAARDLIRETGDPGLSMRSLAARAGVSLATPYNLFGSKRAVLVAVLEDIEGFGTRFAQLRTLDPLDRILGAARLAVSYYEADPAFYRALWASILAASGSEERGAIFNPKRHDFWLRLLDDAVEAGLLLPEIDTALLLRNLDYTFRSVMLHWVIAEIELEDIQPAVGYGYALALRGAATAAGQKAMLRRLATYGKRAQPAQGGKLAAKARARLRDEAAG